MADEERIESELRVIVMKFLSLVKELGINASSMYASPSKLDHYNIAWWDENDDMHSIYWFEGDGDA